METVDPMTPYLLPLDGKGHLLAEHSFRDLKPSLGKLVASIYTDAGPEPDAQLCYDLMIPLEPGIDPSGLDARAVRTSLIVEDIPLAIKNWQDLEGRSFNFATGEIDGSVYLEAIHNPVALRMIEFSRRESLKFTLLVHLFCDFDFSGLGESMYLRFRADVQFEGLIIRVRAPSAGLYTDEDLAQIRGITRQDRAKAGKTYLRMLKRQYTLSEARRSACRLVDLNCYREPEVAQGEMIYKPLPFGSARPDDARRD